MHANFVVPADQRNVDGAFPHFEQMDRMWDAAQSRSSPFDFFSALAEPRPGRRPDYNAEWLLLKKAWRLHRNGKEKLSNRNIETASARFYENDPLNDLADWMWRFSLSLGAPAFNKAYSDAFALIEPLRNDKRFIDFLGFYEAEMVPVRGERYLERMKAFFMAWSEFAQVYFHVSMGTSINDDEVTSSTDFDLVRMFYGDTFEAFSSSVDILAYINNVLCGRSFDTFAQLTKDEYLKLDKAGRKNAFAMNAEFSALCREWDNQIRNASHHGSFRIDGQSQIITYRSGKGGTGPELQLPYAQYLARSTQLFLQMTTLFRIEIMISHMTKTKMPF